MSVVLLAYHEMGCMALRTLLGQGVPISAVYTYEDDPDENCWFGSVAEHAREAGLPVDTATPINSPEAIARISALAPDVILSVYYRDMVKKAVRAIPRHGAFNLHGSLLPKYRGRSPINWQLVHGEPVSGLTLHHMVGRADAGDIVDQESVAVGPDETALELYQKLLPAGEKILARRIHALLEGTAPRTAQDESAATLFGGRTPEDGRIDWSQPARQIHDLVRAVTRPWPGAFCDAPAGRVHVWQTRVHEEASSRPPAGTIQTDGDGRLLVGTGKGLLELIDFEAEAAVGLASGDRLVEPNRA